MKSFEDCGGAACGGVHVLCFLTQSVRLQNRVTWMCDHLKVWQKSER